MLTIIHRASIEVHIDDATGEVLETLDAATGHDARLYHGADIIARVVRFARESILATAEE
jgi:hypothetical protein